MSTPEFVLALREKIGQELLWMPGVTAFVLDPARTRLLAVRRRDNGAWTPVTGIIDPGEQPASAAAGDVVAAEGAREIGGVEHVGDDRTAAPALDDGDTGVPTGDAGDLVPGGDQRLHGFLAEHTGGDPYPADDENSEARWFPLDRPPPLNERFSEQLELVLADRPEARFHR